MTDAERQRYDTAVSKIDSKPRCPWCLGSDATIAYHDEEWGAPVHDERMLFELLILEGAQR
jgi:DNA-3-methyladenine glycosylase I